MWANRFVSFERSRDFFLIVVPGLVLSTGALTTLHLLLEMEFSPWIILRMFSDALILAAGALTVNLLPGFRRLSAFLALFIWSVFQQASFEYELNKFRPLRFEDMRFLDSPEFLLGSGVRVVSIGFFLFFLAASILLARKIAPAPPTRLGPGKVLKQCGMILVCLLLLVILQLPAGRPWQARHPVSAFSYSVVRALKNHVEYGRDEYSKNLSPDDFGQKLSPVIEKGEVKAGQLSLSADSVSNETGTRLAGPAPKSNVLLLVLEGVSGAYLPVVASRENFAPSLVMTNLNSIAEKSFFTPNFVIHMHQTIRGMYSLITGDYPKLDLSSPKAFEVVAMGGGEVESLPRALGRNGYHTVYLQAAGLSFMEKDRFMKAAGFDEVHGVEWFRDKETLMSSGWGIDDYSFLDGSREMLARLETGDKPWFLTMLTVGTHHPYNLVPGSFNPRGVDDWTRSVIYLDHAVGRFFAYLEESGILEDTLVIITSDEFRGYPDKPLKCNWGLNLVLMPEMPAERVNPGLFGQIDLAYSVLDYLGLEGEAESDNRRSFFRSYEDPGRELFFTRDGWGQLWFRPRNLLLRMENGELFAYQLDPAEFFNRDRLVEVEIERELREPLYREMEQIINYLDSSVYTSTDEGPWKVNLADERTCTVPGNGRVVLADGQYFSLPPSRVTLEIQFENETASTGKVRIDECFFYIGNEFRKVTAPSFPWVGPGEEMEFSYSLDFPRSPRQLCLRMVLRGEGDVSRVRIKKALVTAIPFPPGQKAKAGHLNRLVVK